MGGNVFGSTAKINKDDIKPTLKEFLRQLISIFPKEGDDITSAITKHLRTIKTLGSVGKKPTSGDIDLALAGSSFDDINDWGLDEKRVQDLFTGFKNRAKTSTDQQLMKRAVIVALAEKIDQSNTEISCDIKNSGTGTLFLEFPQYTQVGEEKNQIEKTGNNVQIDINIGDVDWLRFAYYSAVYKNEKEKEGESKEKEKEGESKEKEKEGESNVKGLHRTQLLVALFSNKQHTFSHNYGVKDLKTQEIVATKPEQAIDLLNQLYTLNLNRNIVSNYFTFIKALQDGLPDDELKAVYDKYLKQLDTTRCDIPEDLQYYWITNQKRLGLKGKYLPTGENKGEKPSNLLKYKIA
jgi:hypothetical protein